MTTKGKIPFFLKQIDCNVARLDCNAELLDIFQGNLLHYVKKALRKQLKAEQSYSAAESRIPPINVLRRLIDKQSKIYAHPPLRTVSEDSDSDAQEALDWYAKEMNVDQKMNTANEYFNLFKNALIEPYLGANARPCLRIIASNKFVPFAYDHLGECEFPDGFIIPLGHGSKELDVGGGKIEICPTKIFKAVDKDDFTYFNSEGDDLTVQYLPDNKDGVNELGRLPYVYINREPNSIQPTQDSDTYAMTVLIPLLLTDINFAHMFQAFAIIYGINVNFQDLSYSPNAFWSFKTEPGSTEKPEVNVLKPQADIESGLRLVMTQFAFWLQSKGIKPGDVGTIDGASAAQNGISKIMDEMDTSDDRKSQVPFFKEAEERQLWDLILNPRADQKQKSLHEIWSRDPLFGFKTPIASEVKVDVRFAEQIPLVRRKEVVDEVVLELQNRLTTRENAIQRLNPLLTEAQIVELEAEIQAEADGIIDDQVDDNVQTQTDQQQTADPAA